MNYNNLLSRARAADSVGEPLVIYLGGRPVAVKPERNDEIRVFSLDSGEASRTYNQSSFEALNDTKWSVHPNFVSLMDDVGGCCVA